MKEVLVGDVFGLVLCLLILVLSRRDKVREYLPSWDDSGMFFRKLFVFKGLRRDSWFSIFGFFACFFGPDSQI